MIRVKVVSDAPYHPMNRRYHGAVRLGACRYNATEIGCPHRASYTRFAWVVVIAQCCAPHIYRARAAQTTTAEPELAASCSDQERGGYYVAFTISIPRFLSYASIDQPLVAEIAQGLDQIGLHALWDREINPGKPFTDEIKDLIRRSHVFIPIITQNASARPWVHQETGFALALGIPVLPFSIGGTPTEMISQVQAIVLRADLSDLQARLSEINWQNVVLPEPTRPFGVVEIVEWPEQRPESIVQYCNWVSDVAGYAPIRVQARFSVFAVPDVALDDPLWDKREGNEKRSPYMRHWQREERRITERFARAAGCRMILDPRSSTIQGDKAKKIRLAILLDFIRSMPPDKLEIVLSERAQDSSLTGVGDYFTVESVAYRGMGFVQTVVNSHPPTVLKRIQRFDQLFLELQKNNPTTIDEVIRTIEQLLAQS